MIAFVNSLNVINILNLTLKRYLKETNYPFNWTIPALGLTCWNLKMNGNGMDEINFEPSQRIGRVGMDATQRPFTFGSFQYAC